MAPDELKTRARRVIQEILNQGDLAVANELISPDCVHHIPGGQPLPGRAALRDWLALTLSIFPVSTGRAACMKGIHEHRAGPR